MSEAFEIQSIPYNVIKPSAEIPWINLVHTATPRTAVGTAIFEIERDLPKSTGEPHRIHLIRPRMLAPKQTPWQFVHDYAYGQGWEPSHPRVILELLNAFNGVLRDTFETFAWDSLIATHAFQYKQIPPHPWTCIICQKHVVFASIAPVPSVGSDYRTRDWFVFVEPTREKACLPA
jgi:hypothetical protein